MGKLLKRKNQIFAQFNRMVSELTKLLGDVRNQQDETNTVLSNATAELVVLEAYAESIEKNIKSLEIFMEKT